MSGSFDYDALTDQIVGRLRELRKLRRFSGKAVAEAMTADGYPMVRSSVSNLENGTRRTISVPELVAFSRCFKVPVDYFFTGEGLCHVCLNAPPPGFRCETCGQAGEPLRVDQVPDGG